MNWNVYILKSKGKEWYYVGSTNRLNVRLKEHNDGKCQSTKPYIPLQLVFSKLFDIEKEARSYERKLKDCRREKERVLSSLREN